MVIHYPARVSPDDGMLTSQQEGRAAREIGFQRRKLTATRDLVTVCDNRPGANMLLLHLNFGRTEGDIPGAVALRELNAREVVRHSHRDRTGRACGCQWARIRGMHRALCP